MKTVLIVIVIIAVIALVAVALLSGRRKQTERMQEKFGPEYDRTVDEAGNRREAEKDLRERTERVEQLQLTPLASDARQEYAQRWRQTQEQFVDSPETAVSEADRLVAEVMQARGYPAGSFEQQVRDVSVEHSTVVDEYRAAHDMSLRNDEGAADTEELREAMVHYRALFAELLEKGSESSERSNAQGPPEDDASAARSAGQELGQPSARRSPRDSG